MIVRSAPLALLLLLAACTQPQPSTQPERSGRTPTSTATSAAEPDAPVPAPTPSPTMPTPSPTAAELTPEAARGETGARDVLLDFARAVERRDFAAAHAMLAPADRQRWTAPQFAALFAGLDRLTVAVPTGTLEGTAGSSYYTAPVTVTANDRDGRPVRLRGEAILRRVNDVDGATPAQLRWHFERLTLDRAS